MHLMSMQLLIPQYFHNSSTFIIEKIEKLLKTTNFCIIKSLFSLVFIQTSHKAKSHIAKSIIEVTQNQNQAIKCDFHVLWYSSLQTPNINP